jgi:hypothetical protein
LIDFYETWRRGVRCTGESRIIRTEPNYSLPVAQLMVTVNYDSCSCYDIGSRVNDRKL